jgi:hypothetical protein
MLSSGFDWALDGLLTTGDIGRKQAESVGEFRLRGIRGCPKKEFRLSPCVVGHEKELKSKAFRRFQNGATTEWFPPLPSSSIDSQGPGRVRGLRADQRADGAVPRHTVGRGGDASGRRRGGRGPGGRASVVAGANMGKSSPAIDAPASGARDVTQT